MINGAQFDQILWWCFIAITHMYEHAWRNVPCSTGRVPNAWSQKSLSKEGQKTSSFWANLYHHHLCPLNIIQCFKSFSTVNCFTRPCGWVERSGFELVSQLLFVTHPPLEPNHGRRNQNFYWIMICLEAVHMLCNHSKMFKIKSD